MSDREEMGSFLRKGQRYQVFVEYCPFTGVVDAVIVTVPGREFSIKPNMYDETNKLHVNAFIVVTDALLHSPETVIDLLPENWPKDYRLYPSQATEGGGADDFQSQTHTHLQSTIH